ncbi:tetratricopeptide repeat protein [Pedobacter petrophilus]|uniref:Tetratricopeptide repeat protein n=1 Tax=Pedobacter petrophilus TaxID=1908241 RepID=A0A7K0FWE4_9SPHI|nr:tetratricopeptide repeat protein [Pedobacter petrophilus]MRX75550.1 tetratricopeptide repeat protein [Pedobacter petrophilus]
MKKLSTLLLFSLFSIWCYAQNAPVLDKDKLFDLYQSQRYADAAVYLKNVLGDDTQDLKALTQIGYCFLMAGNNVEAEKYYSKAYQIQPQSLSILFSLGNISTKRGNNDKAKKYYGEIVKIDSNNFNVYKLLTNLYPSAKDSLRFVYLLKANQINPNEGDVADDLAEVHAVNQNYDKAYEVLDIAIRADRENLVLQRAKLPIANQLKKYPEVITSGEILMKDGTDAGVIKDVAKAYYYTKKYEKAIKLFSKLETLLMQNENTLYFTSLSYRALKNYKMAAFYTKKTIDEAISPNTSSYYALLGLVYEENSQFALANSAYKKGLQFKVSPTIYYRLATLYDTKLKEPKAALHYYNQYLRSKPDAENDKSEIKFTKDRIAQLNLTD